MSNFTFVPLSAVQAQQIRQNTHDYFGNLLEISPASATGYGPCRCCLQQTLPGENRILFSYAPLGSGHVYHEVGPVFIHAESCTPYTNVHIFPPEVKSGRLPIPLVLRAYSSDRRMIDAILVPDNQQIESLLEQLFNNPSVAFVHVRNAEAQCFICEVKSI